MARKRPLNNIEAPVLPDIRKAPPRFLWSKRHWTVDTGRTLAQVEMIPQLQEAAVLAQSWDYNSQHAYGKRATYDVVVNKEFRPPLQDRDDFLPLSRIPRPVIIPRINPGTAHPSGGSAMMTQNTSINGIDKNMSDRIKHGDVFMAPRTTVSTQQEQILPDLQTKMPSVSITSGQNVRSINSPDTPNINLSQKIQTEGVSGFSYVLLDAPSSMEGKEFSYLRPQVSAGAGVKGITQIEIDRPDYDLQYTRPQVAAGSGVRGYTHTDLDVEYLDLQTKIEGNQPIHIAPIASAAYDPFANVQESTYKLDDYRPQHEQVAPNATRFKKNETFNPHFTVKKEAIGRYTQVIPGAHIRRAGISSPQIIRKKGGKI